MNSEKRLIDANALWKAFDEARLFDSGNPRHIAQQTVEEQPTADAVEVVRCGVCKDWLEIEETGGAGYCHHPCWTIAGTEPPIVQFADFCSYGERKKNENTYCNSYDFDNY